MNRDISEVQGGKINLLTNRNLGRSMEKTERERERERGEERRGVTAGLQMTAALTPLVHLSSAFKKETLLLLPTDVIKGPLP